MRPVTAIASAALLALLALPASGIVRAGAPAVQDAVTDISAAKKKKTMKKKAPKEEYLRAAPMAPPERAKK